MTTQSGQVVKEPKNFKDADYSCNQVQFVDFAFSGSCKEEKI